MLQAYARKVLEANREADIVEFSGNRVSSGFLTGIVMLMPHGCLQIAHHGTSLDDIRIIGQNKTVQDHYNFNFMKGMELSGGEFMLKMCEPYIISGERLMDFDNWEEWKMLYFYLKPRNFVPILTFRNTPVKSANLKGFGYVCDIRIVPQSDADITV